MNEYIEKIYNMMTSPIVTPYNLLENAKLDNYKYVKYYKGESGLICEMECIVDDTNTVFLYYFNEKDFLDKITMKQNSKTKTMFEREKEIIVLKEEFYSKYDNNRCNCI